MGCSIFAGKGRHAEKEHNSQRSGCADKIIRAGGGVLVRFGGRDCSIIVVGIQLSTESTALNIYRVFDRSCIAIIHPAVYT